MPSSRPPSATHSRWGSPPTGPTWKALGSASISASAVLPTPQSNPPSKLPSAESAPPPPEPSDEVAISKITKVRAKDSASPTDKRLAPGDKYAMVYMFEQSLTKTVSKLGAEILANVRAEVQQTLDVFRGDMAVTMTENLEQARISTGDVLQKLCELQQEINKPLDLSAMQEEIRKFQRSVENSVEGAGLLGHHEWMQRLESQVTKLTNNFSHVVDEVNGASWRSQQGENSALFQMHDDIRTGQNRILDRMLQQFVEFGSKNKSMCEHFRQEVHEIEEKALAELHSGVKEYCHQDQEHYATLRHDIYELEAHQSSNFAKLISGLQAVQKATVEGISGEEGKCMRHFGVQTETDEINTCQAETQTDTSTSKHRKHPFPGLKDKLRVPNAPLLPQAVQSVIKFTADLPQNLPQSGFSGPQSSLKLHSLFKSRTEARQKMRKIYITTMLGVTNDNGLLRTTGIARKIATHPYFESFTWAIIVLNMLWIAVDADYNQADALYDASAEFQIADNLFCAYFTFEIIVRLCAYKILANCFKDWWFVLDAIICLIGIAETWVITAILWAMDTDSSTNAASLTFLRMLRIGKLYRTTRILRIVRGMPEVVFLVRGLATASRSMLWVSVMLLLIIYMFALTFRQLTKFLDSDIADSYFRSVPSSMNNLLLDGILPEHAKMMNELGDDSPVLWLLMLFFIMMSILTVLNLLVGVIVECTHLIACKERERILATTATSRLKHAVESLGIDTKAPLSREVFFSILDDAHVGNIIHNDLHIDLVALMDEAEVIWEDAERYAGVLENNGMAFQDFVDMILKMRGTNTATVMDLKKMTRVTKGIVGDFTNPINLYLHNLGNDVKSLGVELMAIKDSLQKAESSEDDSDIGNATSDPVCPTKSWT